MLNKTSLSLVLVVLVFILQFDLNYHQIGLSREVRQTSTCSIGATNGTTRDLKEIVIGRCNYFKNILRRTNCDIASRTYNCSLIWETFYNVTTKNPNCNLDDYTPLLDLTDHDIPENKSLFWSGTYTPAHQYTKITQYWSLEDTFIGFLFDETVFCVSNTTLDFDYVNPSCSFDCNYWDFWSAASRRFAQKARGTILVVLNGSRSIGAISSSSTFNTYELPNFKSVTKVTVLLLLSPNGPIYDTCKSSASLLKLQNTLSTKGIEYECNDDPTDIEFYLCFLDPLSKECQSMKYSTSHGIPPFANKVLMLIAILLLSYGYGLF